MMRSNQQQEQRDPQAGTYPAAQFESNRVQTNPGNSGFVCLRIYGPTEPWIEGKWRPSDVALAK